MNICSHLSLIICKHHKHNENVWIVHWYFNKHTKFETTRQINARTNARKYFNNLIHNMTNMRYWKTICWRCHKRVHVFECAHMYIYTNTYIYLCKHLLSYYHNERATFKAKKEKKNTKQNITLISHFYGATKSITIMPFHLSESEYCSFV